MTHYDIGSFAAVAAGLLPISELRRWRSMS